jgi:histidinol-phosphate aminotransferase
VNANVSERVSLSVSCHGGPDALGVPAFDFSTNSNAAGPCPSAVDALQRADVTRYPDPQYTALRASLAELHGVDVSRVLLAASASEFIVRMSWAVASAQTEEARTAWMPPACYGDYTSAARASGLRVVEDAQQASLLWACEPSSPHGQSDAGLTERIKALAPHQVMVWDAAYAPLRLSGKPSVKGRAKDAVWQLWTPNKALGLTGVRAAYAIAPKVAMTRRAGAEAQALAQQQAGLIDTLTALQPSWPVGAHGVALLQAWTQTDTQQWLFGSLETLQAWKARQIAVCEGLGWQLLPSEANYFLAQPSGEDMAAALLALRQQGIKLRDTASFGLPGWVRLGVLPPPAQDALAQAWTELAPRSVER